MAALKGDDNGTKDNANAPWMLPDWEEYSESAKSSIGVNWSDVEADVSLDTASSVTSTEHQRVYRMQRVRGGYSGTKQQSLKDMHLVYMQRRQEETSRGLSSVHSSTNWFQPVSCVSPRILKEKQQSPMVKQMDNIAERKLLVQQKEISAELQAVRKQLGDFQSIWQKTIKADVVVSAKEEESSQGSTVQSSCSSQVPFRQKRKEAAVQTEEDDAVIQWLLLLTQEVERMGRSYSHKSTDNLLSEVSFQAESYNCNYGDDNANVTLVANDKNTTVESWHIGHALKNVVPSEVAKHFLALEIAIASLNEAVEQQRRRHCINYDRAIQQVQGYHQERLQRVIDESLAELKLVRGRYKKKETCLEEELRTAKNEIEQLKQSSAESKHREKLDRESLEFQLALAKEQHSHNCRRYENELEQLRTQLDVVQAERKQMASQHRDTREVIAQAKEGAAALERQCQALKTQQEQAKELHERKVRELQDTIQQLRESKKVLETQFANDKDALIKSMEHFKRSKQKEVDDLEVRFRTEFEQKIIHDNLPEKVESLKKEHEEVLNTIATEHKRQLEQLEVKLQKTRIVDSSSVRNIETQTDVPFIEAKTSRVNDETHAEIEKLRRRCQALEKLLDRKFQETLLPISSRKCESCHSDDDISTKSFRQDDVNGNRTSIQSFNSIYSVASGKNRALARALLDSSRNTQLSGSKCLGSSHNSLNSQLSDNKESVSIMNETTLATDEATLGSHEMWDSASFTSIDTTDDVSSFALKYVTPRQRTQEMLSLVRQMKQSVTSSHESLEPDPETSWVTPKQNFSMIRHFNVKTGNLNSLPNIAGGRSDTLGTSTFDDLLE
ncbi:hypothetical protein Plhal304r1_c014g0054061 [Plasmopara halstedii]